MEEELNLGRVGDCVTIEPLRGVPDKTPSSTQVHAFARTAGFGCACALVGASIFLPARWRSAALASGT